MFKKANYLLSLPGGIGLWRQGDADTVAVTGFNKLCPCTVLFKELGRKIGRHVKIMREKYFQRWGDVLYTVHFKLSCPASQLQNAV